MGEKTKQAAIEILCDFFGPLPNWWYEVEDMEAETVVHTDGFFQGAGEAYDAGRQWATENGYECPEFSDDAEGKEVAGG